MPPGFGSHQSNKGNHFLSPGDQKWLRNSHLHLSPDHHASERHSQARPHTILTLEDKIMDINFFCTQLTDARSSWNSCSPSAVPSFSLCRWKLPRDVKSQEIKPKYSGRDLKTYWLCGITLIHILTELKPCTEHGSPPNPPQKTAFSGDHSADNIHLLIHLDLTEDFQAVAAEEGFDPRDRGGDLARSSVMPVGLSCISEARTA